MLVIEEVLKIVLHISAYYIINTVLSGENRKAILSSNVIGDSAQSLIGNYHG